MLNKLPSQSEPGWARGSGMEPYVYSTRLCPVQEVGTTFFASVKPPRGSGQKKLLTDTDPIKFGEFQSEFRPVSDMLTNFLQGKTSAVVGVK